MLERLKNREVIVGTDICTHNNAGILFWLHDAGVDEADSHDGGRGR